MLCEWLYKRLGNENKTLNQLIRAIMTRLMNTNSIINFSHTVDNEVPIVVIVNEYPSAVLVHTKNKQ